MIVPYVPDAEEMLDVPDVECWADLVGVDRTIAYRWLDDCRKRDKWWIPAHFGLSDGVCFSDIWTRKANQAAMTIGRYCDGAELEFEQFECEEPDRGLQWRMTFRFADLPDHRVLGALARGEGTRLSVHLSNWRPTIVDAVASAEYRMLWNQRLERLVDCIRKETNG
ncbi:hypothetical protein [Hoyosella altamirensis]|uniref:Uncharacterized protein n=1 Tax=Hoyosella altamirensis TaxID=616997 RepID=A0A839RKB3_9ACTN|nr:hypothetical protein [Hoyosella altamirensis]MBB3036614.1 hypothetical protein [Hoyosella altamirensis]